MAKVGRKQISAGIAELKELISLSRKYKGVDELANSVAQLSGAIKLMENVFSTSPNKTRKFLNDFKKIKHDAQNIIGNWDSRKSKVGSMQSSFNKFVAQSMSDGATKADIDKHTVKQKEYLRYAKENVMSRKELIELEGNLYSENLKTIDALKKEKKLREENQKAIEQFNRERARQLREQDKADYESDVIGKKYGYGIDEKIDKYSKKFSDVGLMLPEEELKIVKELKSEYMKLNKTELERDEIKHKMNKAFISMDNKLKDQNKIIKHNEAIENQQVKNNAMIEGIKNKALLHDHGTTRAYTKNLKTLEEMVAEGKKRLLTEEEIAKIETQRVLTERSLNKGTLWSNVKSNFSLQKLASRVSFVTTATMSYRVMQGIEDAIRRVVELNIKLQDELSKTFAIMVDKSEKAKTKMKTGVIAIMARYNMTLEQTTEGLYNVISAQIDESKALNVLSISAATAKANFSDLGKTTKLIAGILNAYNMGAEEATRVSDVLSESVRLGVVTLDEYAESLGMIVPSANAAGVSYEELVAVITTMTKKGIQANKAITSLRQVFQMLTTPTKKQMELLADYGIDLNVLDLRANGLIKTMGQLGGVLLEDQFGIATSRRGREALLSVLGDLESNYANLDSIMNANGATQIMLAERTSTLASNWDTLGKTISGFLATRGGVEGFFGMLNSLIGSYNEAISLATVQTNEMIEDDVIDVKFSKNFIMARRLTNEINSLTDSTNNLIDPTSEAGKKLKMLNEIYRDAGINADLLSESQVNLSNKLEESIDVYARMATRKLAIDKKAEIQSSIWEIEAKKVSRSRELGIPEKREELYSISLPNGQKYDKELINNVRNAVNKYDSMSSKERQNKSIYDFLGEKLWIPMTDETSGFFSKVIKKTRELRWLGKDKVLMALKLQGIQQQENLITWENVISMSENDTIKTIDKMNAEEADRLKKLEKRKSDLDTSITNFKNTAYDFGDTSDKVQTRSNIQQRITEAKALKGEIESLRKLDPTYDTNGSMLSWANAQINKLEVEFNSVIRDFSDFPITVDKEINDILNKAIDTVNSSMTDKQMEELSKKTIDKILKLGQVDNVAKAEINKWTDDLLGSIRNAFKNYKPESNKNYKPESKELSLDDLSIPLQINISKIIKNGLETVTDSMTQEQYMAIVDDMIEDIASSMFLANGSVNRILIEKLYEELEKSVAGSAIGYKPKKSRQKTGTGTMFAEAIGIDTKALGISELTGEEKIAEQERIEQELIDSSINNAKQLYSQLTSMAEQYYARKHELRMKDIEDERESAINVVNNEIMTSQHRQNEINAINNKFNKKKEKEEEKYNKARAKRERKLAIFEATMQYSLGLVRIWSQGGLFNSIAAGIATTSLSALYAAQMNALTNAKYFRSGGILQGNSHENGGINLYGRNGQYYGNAEGGEAIFSRKATMGNEGILMAQNNYLTNGGTFDKFVSTYLANKLSSNNKMFDNMRFSNGGVTPNIGGSYIDESIFEKFALVKIDGFDERQLFRITEIGRMKDKRI